MPKEMNLVLEIQTRYNELTKAEKKIADYILQNKQKVIYMSITELANVCDVGETSIFRFCRTLDFGGYQEFKMQLSLYLASNENTAEKKDVTYDVDFEKERLEYHLAVLRETQQLLDQKNVIDIVQFMEKAESIYFFGVGGSLQMAQVMWSKFLRISPKVRLITDSHMQAITTSMMTEKDLIFLVSYSGASKDVVDIAEIAKSVGATVVGITRYQKSPLTAYTDAVLLCSSQESPLAGGAMTVQMSQLYLLDILYHTYYERNRASSLTNQQKGAKAVADKLY
ncbi:MurR/RpiR family transcriptional regulator [Enterococcus dongliensis]|uniref:MurR/RpiR family transcriptional regulator n=1 Tax=Enterococcus dongliensis TaxID=2559925 RepID=A0AAP5KRE5_9ENTE|nr:MurR/RpiR family transcriptional regulator [Enterococcus dongliensis]MDT2596643.1 MurR/RpiR family transcriptional regulator [Enterococcus dongliensis]MDT2604170.1 MurR/RpiR family transcriptional regulator [Enterococcus dongliensis]MDT2634638.1 MurR/RpiR family transcriptional regulator [Enterococcus dongliensis]MDT2637538.1 MurR/RpiR family transcriptional regulator [Enterococcus dongliensis]MDT2642656.1 MurR/RpiR family transcriptional regulator [Enterococcus dongliensis]